MELHEILKKVDKVLTEMQNDGIVIDFDLDAGTLLMIAQNAECNQWNECIMHLGGTFTNEFRKRYYPEQSFI
jgi:hypothetical protein